MESARGEWNGDVNLGDGKLEELFDLYKVRQQQCRNLGLTEPRSVQHVQHQVQETRQEIVQDAEYISNGKYMYFAKASRSPICIFI